MADGNHKDENLPAVNKQSGQSAPQYEKIVETIHYYSVKHPGTEIKAPGWKGSTTGKPFLLSRSDMVRVHAISIRAGEYVDAIEVTFDTVDTSLFTSPPGGAVATTAVASIVTVDAKHSSSSTDGAAANGGGAAAVGKGSAVSATPASGAAAAAASETIITSEMKTTKQIIGVGGSGGQLHRIELAPNEYIISVSGRGDHAIDQLSFTTNLARTFGPYGGGGGHSFVLNPPQGSVVVGFSGMSDQFIRSIGIYYRPL